MATKIAAIATSMISDLALIGADKTSPDEETELIDDTQLHLSKMDGTLLRLCLQKLDAIDKEWSDAIHKLEFGVIDFLIAIPATLFGVIGCPFLAVWYYHKYESLLYPMNCLVVVIVNHTAKYIFNRKRPKFVSCGKKMIPLKRMHHDPAMPSGDTAQSAVAAVTLLYHGYNICWSLIVPASAFARVYFGSHYIGDTIVGAVFAWCMSYAIHICFG
eukprot:CAMPEP_0202694874 /NCGR_PEP_ID=MMETSP1385-20130828/8617_1 /ASSEMBLY_ACC=CAM_ASM_000861 /TAXON_ID=933848 /ORGANISM="Elphidium margaritaceum" /LENGTH=215 /DNA_ID=CAMNT_0049350801 /DNA_START=101 /DNA_END=748 /DNA_ORIENTATION=+